MPVRPKVRSLFTLPGTNFSKGEFHDKDAQSINGDSWICHTHARSHELVVGVMDGARAPYTYKIDGLPTDFFASHRLQKLLLDQLTRGRCLPASAKDMVAACIPPYAQQCNRLRQQIDGGKWRNEPARTWNPAAAFAMAVFHKDGRCTVAQGADCFVVAVYRDGRKRLLTPDKNEAALLRGLKKEPPKPIKQLLAEHTREDVLDIENDITRYNRKNLYNQPNGFAVFNGEEEMLTCGQMTVLTLSPGELEDIQYMVFLTDGMIVGRGEQAVLDAAGTCATVNPGKHYGQKVFSRFAPDPVAVDATCIVLELDHV